MVRSRLSIFITVVEILALPLLITASTAKLSALPPCAEKPGTTPSVYLSTQRSVISYILQLKNGSFPKFSSIASSVHASGPNTTANYLFGTLETANGSIFTTLGLSYADVAKKEHDAGVAVANVTLAWKDYETSDGVFNENQMAYVANSINTFLQAGQRVDVQLAIHYVPSWVMQIPNAYYVNQCGVTAPQSYYDSPNYVFNNTVRQKVQNFETHALQQLNARVGLNNIWDFRVDGGDGGEANYGPSADGQGHSNSYWAHDERLYTTTDTPSANIITLTDYSSIINQYNSNTVRVSTAVAYTDHTALNKTFPITVMNNNVEIDFSARLDNAMISAIQIVPTG